MFRTSLLVSAALVASVPVAGQDAPATTLKKGTEANAFVHEASKSQFTLPQGWVVAPNQPSSARGSAVLTVRQAGVFNQGEMPYEVLITWTPLLIKFDEVLALENNTLAQIYGLDRVSKPAEAKAGDKAGFKFTIEDGPLRTGKEVGAVYVFEAGPDERNRWKIKVRGIVPTLGKDDGMKAVETLVQNLKW